MIETAPRVITIPAKPEMQRQQVVQRQLRVAAYCRVSTDDEEQLTSYEAQKKYYTDKIMTTKNWTMAGIFADEGITGTSARKRPEFLRMIRQCRQKKIDIILTKSISRFARNTVDCLKYIRILKELGIAIIFEKESINTLETDSEILITLLSAFAQAESESISANVAWGKRQAMREGKVSIQYKKLFGYKRGGDGKPEIIPEQAEVVKEIYERYLAGASINLIKQYLESKQIPNTSGKIVWSTSVIRSILTNEKYCGDVLQQKTFTTDCITKKVVRNTGQLPMYLIENYHKGIVDKKTFEAVQTEIARRAACRSPSQKNAPTGMGRYTSKFALTERLVCGECGTLYRRCTWSNKGKKKVVWRCVSRLDYGKKYCHSSPTLEEGELQRSILAAINKTMSKKDVIIHRIKGTMELIMAPIPGEEMTLSDIERRLQEVDVEFGQLLEQAVLDNAALAYSDRFKELTDECAALKTKREVIQKRRESDAAVMQYIERAANTIEEAPIEIEEWDETLIRQIVDTVKVVSAEKIIVYLRGGVQIEQDMIK